ncbi:MAG: hypothetical protein IKH11_05190 [Bacteroidales bacterium]|nr:hypothetical protein [Bacteroidales bacterium]
MDSPFIYNRPVSGRYFVGRKSALSLISNFFRDGENVVIYEPPKAGKDSLLQQAFFNMKLESKQFRVVRMSLLNIRSITSLCLGMGSEILRSFGSSAPEYASLVSQVLEGTHFVFDEREWQGSGHILSLGWDIDDDDIRAVFTLPYRLARAKGIRLFVCLDEFQNVMLTEDGDRVCRIMQDIFKARTQEDRESACYVLYGSQLNAMKDIFGHRHLFHRQVERVELGTIDAKDIADSVNRGFLSSGKVIDRGLLLGVCERFRNNVYYINFFASICDSLSKGYIMEPVLKEALDCLMAIHEPRFRAIMSDLTTFQVGLLRAVVDGYTRFSSAEVVHRYALNSSANVRRLKDALCKKEILTFDEEDNPVIIDPLFEYWVTNNYFEIK